MRTASYREAVREALREELERDERVFLLGEDIGPFGGTNKATLGLWEEFGEERIRNTPISESAIIGAAVGAAITGMRPVVEIMFRAIFCAVPDFIRVEPQMTSGPTGNGITRSTLAGMSAVSLQVISTVPAFACRAYSSPAWV